MKIEFPDTPFPPSMARRSFSDKLNLNWKRQSKWISDTCIIDLLIEREVAKKMTEKSERKKIKGERKRKPERKRKRKKKTREKERKPEKKKKERVDTHLS